MVSPYKIKYAGVFSDELNMPDLIMDVAIDSDNGETSTFLNREAVSSESYNGRYKRIHSFKYTETFAPKFTFFKRDFSEFEIAEVRALLKWLTSKDTTALLETYYDDSNVVTWASIGGWAELQTYKIANNRTVAITAVWDSIMPFALSDLYTTTKIISTPINTMMYRWTTSSVDGSSMPQQLLTHNNVLSIDDKLYTFTENDNGVIDKTSLSLYGVVSGADGDVYTVNQINFTVSESSAAQVQDMNNKITIEIDTDDNKPVYPRVTINHGYGEAATPHSVVSIPTGTTLNHLSDMIENTVYFNGTTYYWKTAKGTDEAYFNSSTTKPNIETTSVRIRNTHTDFFNQSKTLDEVVVKNNTNTEQIMIDGANKIVSTNRVGRIFGDDFNWVWLELYDGKNEITVEGNCTVTIEYREVRKVGEF